MISFTYLFALNKYIKQLILILVILALNGCSLIPSHSCKISNENVRTPGKKEDLKALMEEYAEISNLPLFCDAGPRKKKIEQVLVDLLHPTPQDKNSDVKKNTLKKRKPDKRNPAKRAGKKTSAKRTDKGTSAKRTDKKTSVKRTDKKTSVKRADKKTSVKRTDKETSAKRADKETSAKRADKKMETTDATPKLPTSNPEKTSISIERVGIDTHLIMTRDDQRLDVVFKNIEHSKIYIGLPASVINGAIVNSIFGFANQTLLKERHTQVSPFYAMQYEFSKSMLKSVCSVLPVKSLNKHQELRTRCKQKDYSPKIKSALLSIEIINAINHQLKLNKIDRRVDLPTREEWIALSGGHEFIYPWGSNQMTGKSVHCGSSQSKSDSGDISPIDIFSLSGGYSELTRTYRGKGVQLSNIPTSQARDDQYASGLAIMGGNHEDEDAILCSHQNMRFQQVPYSIPTSFRLIMR